MIRAEVLTLFKVPTTDLTIFPVHISPADIGNVPKVSDLQSSSRIFNSERMEAGWKLVSRPETCHPDKNMSRHNIYKAYMRIF